MANPFYGSKIITFTTRTIMTVLPSFQIYNYSKSYLEEFILTYNYQNNPNQFELRFHCGNTTAMSPQLRRGKELY